jgi:hypothetical protein
VKQPLISVKSKFEKQPLGEKRFYQLKHKFGNNIHKFKQSALKWNLLSCADEASTTTS